MRETAAMAPEEHVAADPCHADHSVAQPPEDPAAAIDDDRVAPLATSTSGAPVAPSDANWILHPFLEPFIMRIVLLRNNLLL